MKNKKPVSRFLKYGNVRVAPIDLLREIDSFCSEAMDLIESKKNTEAWIDINQIDSLVSDLMELRPTSLKNRKKK